MVPFCGVMSVPDSPWWPLCVGAACAPRQHTRKHRPENSHYTQPQLPAIRMLGPCTAEKLQQRIASIGRCTTDTVQSQDYFSRAFPHLCGHDSVVQLAGWGCKAGGRRRRARGDRHAAGEC